MTFKKRLAKALVYRSISWTITFLVLLLLTGNLTFSSSSSLLMELVATIGYIIYDKLWDDLCEKK